MQIANIQDVLNRIDILIVQSGMTKQEFYSRSGISSGSFSQWNTGTHSPSVKKLQCAADTLNVSLNYILYGDTTPPVEPEKAIKKDLPQGEVDAITQALLDFAINGTSEQKEDALQYIQFLKSKRGKD